MPAIHHRVRREIVIRSEPEVRIGQEVSRLTRDARRHQHPHVADWQNDTIGRTCDLCFAQRDRSIVRFIKAREEAA